MSYKTLFAALLLGSCLRPGEPITPDTIQIFTLPSDGSAPLFLDVPFPSDLYREGDGTLIALPGLERLTTSPNIAQLSAAYDRMNGFGLTTGAFFAFSEEIDPQGLTTDIAGLVDVEPNSPTFGEEVNVELRFDAPRKLVSILPAPGIVLREGTRYAAYIKRALVDTKQRPVLPSPEFTDALANNVTVQALLQPAIEVLTSRGILVNPEDLLGITVYTTQSSTKDLVAVREMLDDPQKIPAPQIQFPDPTLIFDTAAEKDALLGDSRDANGVEILGRDQPGGVAHAHVGVVASGLFPSPKFQPEDAGTDDDEQFAYDAQGLPVVFDDGALIPVYVVLPDPAQNPMPPSGYPVIIWQHGFSSSRIEVWDFGDEMLSRGFALVAIDAVTHGSRFPGSTDTKNNLARDGFTGDAAIKDGIADSETELAVQLAFFEGLTNLAGFRDNLRQTIIDLMALARLVREPSLDLSALAGPGSPFAGTTIKLDAQKLFYYGESFGGIEGSTFSSLEPTLKGSVLNVPSASLLTDTLPGSAVIGGAVLPLLKLLWLLPEEFHFTRDDIFLQVAQGVLDGGDPMSYAPHALKEPFVFNGVTAPRKNLLLFEVIGDELLANAATEGLARAFGVSLMSPFYPGGPFHLAGDELGLPICDVSLGECDGNVDGFTAVMLQESPATHGANLSGHSGVLSFQPGFPFPEGDALFPALEETVLVRNPLEEGVAVIAQYLSALRDGAPTQLTHPIAPRADFDDDGATDDIDTAPTNPFIQ